MKKLKCEFCGELMEWNKGHICKEIKKEKESLDKKTIKCVCGGDDENRRILYHEKDLKSSLNEFLEELKADLCVNLGDMQIIDRIAKEKWGKLVE